MSLVNFSSPPNQRFGEVIQKYRFQLSDPKLTLSDIHQMADHLALILADENGSKIIKEEMTAFFDEIENEENQRRLEDQKLFSYIHQLSFEIKQLMLQVDVLMPDEVEVKLNELFNWHTSLCKHNAFQAEFFQKELDYLLAMLEELFLEFHFPLIRILKKSDNDEILRCLENIKEYFFERDNELIISKKILKIFLEKKLQKTVEYLKEEKNRFFVTQIALDYLFEKNMKL
jgi:hypothetical protein